MNLDVFRTNVATCGRRGLRDNARWIPAGVVEADADARRATDSDKKVMDDISGNFGRFGGGIGIFASVYFGQLDEKKNAECSKLIFMKHADAKYSVSLCIPDPKRSY